MSEPQAKFPRVEAHAKIVIPVAADVIADIRAPVEARAKVVVPAVADPFADIRPFKLLDESGNYNKDPDFVAFEAPELYIDSHRGAWDCFIRAVKHFVFDGNKCWNGGKPTSIDDRAPKNPFRDSELDHEAMFAPGRENDGVGLDELVCALFNPTSGMTAVDLEDEEDMDKLANGLFEHATRQDILKAVVYICLWAYQFRRPRGVEEFYYVKNVDLFFQAFESSEFDFAKTPEYHDFVSEALRLAKRSPLVLWPPAKERKAWWYVPKPRDNADRFIQCLYFLGYDVLGQRVSHPGRGVYTAFRHMDSCISDAPHIIYERLDLTEDPDALEEWGRRQQDIMDFFGTKEPVDFPNPPEESSEESEDEEGEEEESEEEESEEEEEKPVVNVVAMVACEEEMEEMRKAMRKRGFVA